MYLRTSILFLLVWVSSIMADMPSRLWTTPNASVIMTTKEEVSQASINTDTIDVQTSDTSQLAISSNRHIKDLPLAKTYPVDAVPKDNYVGSYNIQSIAENQTDTSVKNLNRLQAIIEREVAKQRQDVIQQPSQDMSVVPTKASANQDMANKEPMRQMTEISNRLTEYVQIWWDVLREHMKLIFMLLLLLFILGILLIVLKRQNSIFSILPYQRDELAMEISTRRLLERFFMLKGEVHQCFLDRKQNILFNDDFSHYQKAKALIELEKEYTHIEFMELPKLFSGDFNRFLEGQRALLAREELKEIIEHFIEEILRSDLYTKRQKELITRNMKRYYNTARHTWHYRSDMDYDIDNEETAYLLQ